ncbi:MAG TPA: 16S rRNA (adenine(1518)-N(6)/adenine(1519)-N(6))-dimethyltransferase RsmA [Burkholderiaceae bacterium]|nr:16S rRNA (adenine(1518)-N(6)/adenine(1519)-N(6))-dimethyltransferase RsmA [Burkholderiaceae bacterium]
MEGHRARRRFSQNFLHDAGVIDRIVAAIDPHPRQHLVEIGPGTGALTQRLIARAGHICAIEIDRDLAARLRKRYTPDVLDLINADALQLDWRQLAKRQGGALRIVGNLPYHVSTPLLFCLLPIADQVQDQHFMLQREVVERMVATPGGKDYGRLSVMLQFRYHIERLFHVGSGSFHPAPKVQSSVVRMKPLDAEQLPPVALPVFAAVVAAAFSQRRKTLRNALRNLLTQVQIEQALVDPGARAEALDIAAFVRLANCVAHDELAPDVAKDLPARRS